MRNSKAGQSFNGSALVRTIEKRHERCFALLPRTCPGGRPTYTFGAFKGLKLVLGGFSLPPMETTDGADFAALTKIRLYLGEWASKLAYDHTQEGAWAVIGSDESTGSITLQCHH